MLSLKVFTSETATATCRLVDPRWLDRPCALAELLSREATFFDSIARLTAEANATLSDTANANANANASLSSSFSSASRSLPPPLVSVDALALCMMTSRTTFGREARTFLLLAKKTRGATNGDKEGAGGGDKHDDDDDDDDDDQQRQVESTRRAGLPSRLVSLSPSTLLPETREDELALRRAALAGLVAVPVNVWSEYGIGGRGGDNYQWCRWWWWWWFSRHGDALQTLRDRLVVVDRHWQEVRFARHASRDDLPPQLSPADQRRRRRQRRQRQQQQQQQQQQQRQPPRKQRGVGEKKGRRKDRRLVVAAVAKALPLDVVLRAARAARTTPTATETANRIEPGRRPPRRERGGEGRRRTGTVPTVAETKRGKRQANESKQPKRSRRGSTEHVRLALDALTLETTPTTTSTTTKSTSKIRGR